MNIKFQKIESQGNKTVKCICCGKKLFRKKIFYQTLNPFNKDSNGNVKNVKTINAELDVKIAGWKKEDECCRKCEGMKLISEIHGYKVVICKFHETNEFIATCNELPYWSVFADTEQDTLKLATESLEILKENGG